MIVAPGATDVSVLIDIQDARSYIGAGLTGLVHNSSGLTCYYARPGAAAVAVTLASLAAPDSAHADGGFVEVDATHAPGLYRLDLPDAAVAVGAAEVAIYLVGAANMVRARRVIELMADLSTADVLHDIATGVTEFLGGDGQTAVRTATRYGDVTIDGANWTNATKTLTLVGAFANYVWRDGDTITLTAGTGVVAGQYTIASRVDDDSITLATDINGDAGDVSDNSIDGEIVTGRWLDRMS